MRLNSFQLKTIIKTFETIFPKGDTLWLFGSRADDSRRGGDIDLFIESSIDYETLFKLQKDFWCALQHTFNEQKIDIAVCTRGGEKPESLYKEVQETGVKLVMNDLEKLRYEIEVCDEHKNILKLTLDKAKHILPINPWQVHQLVPDELFCLETMGAAYCRLQDAIGKKVFTLILKRLENYEEKESFIDNLNKLEKLEIIETVEFWLNIRNIRNFIIHHYHKMPLMRAEQINGCYSASIKLLDFWEKLKIYINDK